MAHWGLGVSLHVVAGRDTRDKEKPGSAVGLSIDREPRVSNREPRSSCAISRYSTGPVANAAPLGCGFPVDTTNRDRVDGTTLSTAEMCAYTFSSSLTRERTGPRVNRDRQQTAAPLLPIDATLVMRPSAAASPHGASSTR